jgi:hypothetical protein
MLFQNLKAIGEELSEICILFSKYIYIFIYIDSPFHITTCFGLYRPSSSEMYTDVFRSYYAYPGSVLKTTVYISFVDGL